MSVKQLRFTLLLILTAFIWGMCFVAQRKGMDSVGPYTFIAVRNVLSALALLPLSLHRRKTCLMSGRAVPGGRALVIGGLCCGTALFWASAAQQVGIGLTSVGKAGFLTALYIVIVPLAGLFFGRRPGKILWLSVALAVAGMYFLCLMGVTQVNGGDMLCLLCALIFSAHIMLIDRFSPHVDGVMLANLQFLVCGLWAIILTLMTETVTLSGILDAAGPLLYAGLLSGAVGYTLQIIAQKHVNPTVASLAMSLESVFSALAGWMILGQSLSGREIFGCALMFSAIILAQLPSGAAREGS